MSRMVIAGTLYQKVTANRDTLLEAMLRVERYHEAAQPEERAYRIFFPMIDYSDKPLAAKRNALEFTIIEMLKNGSDKAPVPGTVAATAKKIVARIEKAIRAIEG